MAGKIEQARGSSILDRIHISRRGLGVGALVVGAGALGVMIPGKAEASATPDPQSELGKYKENLQAAGLADFTGMFERMYIMREMLGGVGPLPLLEVVLYQKAKGNSGSLGVIGGFDFDKAAEGLAGEWGQKEGQVLEDALASVDSFPDEKIDTGETGDGHEVVRSQLKQEAQVYPAPVIAATKLDKIKISDSEFHTDFLQKYVSLMGPANGESVALTALHEIGGHVFERYFWDVREYINKGKFIHYYEADLDTILQTAYLAFTSPENTIYTAQNGFPLLNPYLDESGQNRVWELYEKFMPADLKEPDIDTIVKIAAGFGPTDAIPLYLLNRVAHYVGKNLISAYVKRTTSVSEPLSAEEQRIYDDGDKFELMGLVMGEIAHFYVGPVQKAGGGLPRSEDPIPDGYIYDLNAALQRLRLWAFSPLGINATYSQIADIFKQPEPIPNAETATTTQQLLVKHGAELVGEMEVGPGGEKVSLLKLPTNLFGERNYYFLNYEQLKSLYPDVKGWIITLPKESDLVAENIDYNRGNESNAIMLIETADGRQVIIQVGRKNGAFSAGLNPPVAGKESIDMESVVSNPVELTFGPEEQVKRVVSPISFAGDLRGQFGTGGMQRKNQGQVMLTQHDDAFHVFYEEGYGGESPGDKVLYLPCGRDKDMVIARANDGQNHLFVEGTVSGQISEEGNLFALPVKPTENAPPGEYLLYYKPDNDKDAVILEIAVDAISAKMLDGAITQAVTSEDKTNRNSVLIPRYWPEMGRIVYNMVVGKDIFHVALESIKWRGV